MISEQEQAILHAAKEIVNIRREWETTGTISIQQEMDLYTLYHQQKQLLVATCKDYDE